MSTQQSPAGVVMKYFLGACLPHSCAKTELTAATEYLTEKSRGAVKLGFQCGFVEPVVNNSASSKQMTEFLGWGVVPVRFINSFPITTGTIIAFVFLGLIALLLLVGTWLQVRMEAKKMVAPDAVATAREIVMGGGATSEPLQPLRASLEEPLEARPGKLTALLLHWSLLRNGRSFVKMRKPEDNTFACLDAVRVLSMGQVILGHSYIYAMMSVGFTNFEQFQPPNGLMGGLPFTIITGCFYGVDSFFLMSGFLCGYSLEKKVFSKPDATGSKQFSLMYVKFLVMRYLRLIPLEMFCIALVYWVLPLLGSGVLWNLSSEGSPEMGMATGGHCFGAAGGEQCADYWWTNLLFIQNFDQFLGKCMPHTWYLAADFQIYLTAPFFGLAYALDKRLGWGVLATALAFGIAIPMILMGEQHWVPDLMLGGHDFSRMVYMKPWTRLSPFVIGIGMAWLWNEKLSRHTGPHKTKAGAAMSAVLGLVALGLLAGATFLRVLFYDCDMQQCTSLDKNPAGQVFAYLWSGLSIPCWALGMAILMTLCFQKRFLPILQDTLHSNFWQPLAKLTYAAYLIHTSVLILDFCQRNSMITFSVASHMYSFAAYVVLTMMMAFALWITVEKPLANLQMALLGGGGD